MSDQRLLVMNALAALINGATFDAPVNGASTWVTPVATSTPRKLRMFDTIAPDQQPAVFLVTHAEEDEYRGLGLIRRRLRLGVWCYSRSDNSSGQTDLDTMMTALEKQFASAVDDPGHNAVTLGDLVYWVRIEGRVLKDPGDLDNQTLMIVPLLCEMP